MKSFETTLTERGVTTVPKALREALDATGGGRIIWRVTAEGTLEAKLKHTYPLQAVPLRRGVVAEGRHGREPRDSQRS